MPQQSTVQHFKRTRVRKETSTPPAPAGRCLDHSLWEVHFVSHHNDGDLPCDFTQLRDPLRDVLVTVAIGDLGKSGVQGYSSTSCGSHVVAM